MTNEPLAARLELWSRINAPLMLCSMLFATLFERLWPLGAVAAPSFLLLVGMLRGQWTPTGAFGWANAVTALRLLLVTFVALALRAAPGPMLSFFTFGILALDSLDGWLAQRTGSMSQFGAHFDMETDAVFVLVMAEELWLRQQLGAWILVPGLLRYCYVLWTWLLPKGIESRPRTNFGRVAFATLIIGLALAFVLPKPLGTLAAGLGTILVATSFALSFYGFLVSAIKSRATDDHSRGAH